MKILRPLVLSLCAAAAHAECSRPIQVPVASTGMSVIVHGAQVSGIYPDILAGVSSRTGCRFVYQPVPRARLEALFEAGRADLLFPAPRTPKRDPSGTFIPLVQARATIISIDPKLPVIHSLAQLKEANLRLAIVRGFDYGPTYQQFIEAYKAAGRVYLEVDPIAVARLLKAGFADATIMTPTVLAGAIQEDSRVADLLQRLRVDPVPELAWIESGIYLSNRLNESDRQELMKSLSEAAASSAVWDSYKRYYPAELLTASLRPR
ncbi:ABC transporter substrate-binding protein [Massilia sp. TS11]|uniref:substrate-binding periplasmic protein n=1 Tax=Massilia sp. TS11 TaxID=2908003 RepID=UPI001EDA8A3A|nr:transporter substrate-binding domain-containing protein [Massilia sp. TS11]MCG2584507.1 transporter substrate-binding domain-containing protein [Massilia sp. TS11]